MIVDTAVLETEFHTAQEAVQHQGDSVRALKAQLKDGSVQRVSRAMGARPRTAAGRMPPVFFS